VNVAFLGLWEACALAMFAVMIRTKEDRVFLAVTSVVWGGVIAIVIYLLLAALVTQLMQ
jgi:hypothetical protein